MSVRIWCDWIASKHDRKSCKFRAGRKKEINTHEKINGHRIELLNDFVRENPTVGDLILVGLWVFVVFIVVVDLFVNILFLLLDFLGFFPQIITIRFECTDKTIFMRSSIYLAYGLQSMYVIDFGANQFPNGWLYFDFVLLHICNVHKFFPRTVNVIEIMKRRLKIRIFKRWKHFWLRHTIFCITV